MVLALFAVIVASTALLKAPQHGILSGGFDRDAYEFLLRTNWIRIVAWSVYALLGLWMVWQTVSLNEYRKGSSVGPGRPMRPTHYGEV